ncbi:hypothetical protein ACH9D2_18575 [Kocuria sp. M4R2S49]|uniref:hypothetical protein n=1 Tax=Kocuria rhizosphaericola TaxID=3376284 RepID=UPI003795827D
MTRLASATAQDAIGDIGGRTASEGEPRMTASRSVAEVVVPDEGAATERHTTPAGLTASANLFEQCRGPATRYDELALTYRGGAALRAITIWLKALLADMSQPRIVDRSPSSDVVASKASVPARPSAQKAAR